MKEKSEAVAEGTVTEQQWVPVQRVVFPGESRSMWTGELLLPAQR